MRLGRKIRLLYRSLLRPRLLFRAGMAAVDPHHYEHLAEFVLDPEYKAKYGKTVADWMGEQYRETMFKKVTWMGVKLVKLPFDLWIYQEILYRTKPEVVVEIGSFEGGSTLYFAHLLDILGEGQVISVDIDRSNYHVSHPRITEVTGDCLAPAIFDRVRELCESKRTMIVHDGDHHEEHVRACLELYGPLVTPGCYFIVEDAAMDVFHRYHPMGSSKKGPLGAIRGFVESSPDFEIDRACERYGITQNPNGYLLRVKDGA